MDKLDLLSILNLIFTACVACKNQVGNRQKVKNFFRLFVKGEGKKFQPEKIFLQIEQVFFLFERNNEIPEQSNFFGLRKDRTQLEKY